MSTECPQALRNGIPDQGQKRPILACIVANSYGDWKKLGPNQSGPMHIIYFICLAGNLACTGNGTRLSVVKPQVQVVLPSVDIGGARTFFALSIVLDALVGEIASVQGDREVIGERITQGGIYALYIILEES